MLSLRYRIMDRRRSVYSRIAAVATIALAYLPFASGQQLVDNDKLAITIEASLPSARTNPAYRAYLNGLINFTPKLQYKFYNDFYGAVGLRYMYSDIADYKVPEPMVGGEHIYGGFLEAGWSSWQTKNFAVEIGLRAGMARHDFITDSTRVQGAQRIDAFFVQPQLSLILASDEAVAYRWVIGYCIDNFRFNPSNLGMDTQGGYTPDDLNKSSQSLMIGFAFTWYFGNKRSEE